MASLFRKYRPKSWNELIGHTQVKRSIMVKLAKGELGGSAYMITGPSGCGKTSIAHLTAAEICDTDNFVELDAGRVTPAAVDDLEKSLRFRCIGEKTGRAVFVNEAHGLRKDTIRQLLVTLERIPKHVAWVFTTTYAGQQVLFDGIDADPLMSRCTVYEIDGMRYLPQFAARAQEIAETEELGGALPIEYMELAKRCKGNFRKMLSEIEAGHLFRERRMA